MSANGKRKPDDLLVALLAAGKTARDAAPLCGCSERHVSRRLADPDFVAKVNAARSQLAADCTGRLAALLTEAVDTLGALLGSTMDAVRLGAARSVLDCFGKMTDLVSTQARLAEVESFMREAKANG